MCRMFGFRDWVKPENAIASRTNRVSATLFMNRLKLSFGSRFLFNFLPAAQLDVVLILLGRTGCATSISDVRLHQFRQALAHVGMIGEDVRLLAQIGGEIIKFAVAIELKDQFP